jgi:hypothetical protein
MRGWFFDFAPTLAFIYNCIKPALLLLLVVCVRWLDARGEERRHGMVELFRLQNQEFRIQIKAPNRAGRCPEEPVDTSKTSAEMRPGIVLTFLSR